ncbi:uncharacterized protein LOC111616123 [Centruroides sculpturatus]|uniref:uncharacterized protein LOC111616123 n=1 Tax=Centruroides sculpturatus TaxID=218467 RepID=UPI000C6D789D|nr:uncharacterized protein LOC111616123 [Centruroides sculpturatus]
MNSYVKLLLVLLSCFIYFIPTQVNGWTKVDPNSSNIRDMTKWAISMMNDTSGFELYEICSAEYVVEFGTYYRIFFLFQNQRVKSYKVFCKIAIYFESETNRRELKGRFCEPQDTCEEEE